MSRRRDWDLWDERVLQVWAALEEWLLENGYPPTVRELAQRTGINRTAMNEYLHRLADMGVIEHKRGVARGWRLLKTRVVQGGKVHWLPLPHAGSKRLPVDDETGEGSAWPDFNSFRHRRV